MLLTHILERFLVKQTIANQKTKPTHISYQLSDIVTRIAKN